VSRESGVCLAAKKPFKAKMNEQGVASSAALLSAKFITMFSAVALAFA
jgi:hypothetical protein